MLLWYDAAGKSHCQCNKEEEVNGCHNTFPGCINVHFSHLYLLVDQVRIPRVHRSFSETTPSSTFWYYFLIKEGYEFCHVYMMISLADNTLYFHLRNCNDMPCKGWFQIRLDKMVNRRLKLRYWGDYCCNFWHLSWKVHMVQICIEHLDFGQE